MLTDFVPVVMNCTSVNKSKNKVCLFLEQNCINDLHADTAHSKTAVTKEFFPLGTCAFFFSRIIALLSQTFSKCFLDFRTCLQLAKIIWNFDLILQIPILQESLQFLLI